MTGMSEAQVVAPHKLDSGLTNQSGSINQKRPRVGDGTPGPGRPRGQSNRVTQTIKDAIEIAARDCHPKGLAGWLVERANGSLGDRQIFAGLVGRVVPLQVNQNVNGGISINLNWLGGRAIGTVSAQPKVIDAQTVELIEDSGVRRWIADGNTDAGHAPEAVGAAEASQGHQGIASASMTQPEPVKGQGGGVFDSSQTQTPHPPSNPAGGV